MAARTYSLVMTAVLTVEDGTPLALQGLDQFVEMRGKKPAKGKFPLVPQIAFVQKCMGETVGGEIKPTTLPAHFGHGRPTPTIGLVEYAITPMFDDPTPLPEPEYGETVDGHRKRYLVPGDRIEMGAVFTIIDNSRDHAYVYERPDDDEVPYRFWHTELDEWFNVKWESIEGQDASRLFIWEPIMEANQDAR
jgi:hypothetical protein